MTDYNNTFQGNILDPIHGAIKISELEKWILFQKPFNRLKRIKQNTFLYYVFPSANHSRFEHSIGVMHLASQIFEYIIKNHVSYLNKIKKYDVEAPKDFDVVDVQETIGSLNLPVVFQELRLAALLHDIGHGPMSHKFDEFTLTKDQFYEIIKSDEITAPYLDKFKNFLNRNKKVSASNRVDHEVVSCLFTLKLIAKLKEESKNNTYKFTEENSGIIEKINAENIVKMIEPDFQFEPIKFNGYDFTNYFSSIISSFPIDVDRMDYLLRDSYFSGVNYGLYDLSRLFMSLLPVALKADKKVTIALKESGLDSIVRFIQSRTHLYNQIYYHKTNRSANKLLDFCCRTLISDTTSLIEAKNYQKLEDFYWSNSDELFLWFTLENKIPNNTVEYEVLQELKQRKLWKRIYEKKLFSDAFSSSQEDDIKKIIDRIKVKLKNIENAKSIYATIDLAFSPSMKDAGKSKIVYFYKEGPTYKLDTNFWEGENYQLKKIKFTEVFVRIYLRRSFKSPKEYTEQSKIINEEIAAEVKELESLFNK